MDIKKMRGEIPCIFLIQFKLITIRHFQIKVYYGASLSIFH